MSHQPVQDDVGGSGSKSEDLHALFARVAEALEPEARARGLSLTLCLSPRIPRSPVPTGEGVAGLLRDMLRRAIATTPAGGVGLRAVIDHEDESAVRLCVSVSDTGSGELAETDEELARRAAALGLRVSRCAEPGRGSTAWFALPVQRGDARSVPAAFDLRRARVVLIGDRHARADVSAALSEIGLEPSAGAVDWSGPEQSEALPDDAAMRSADVVVVAGGSTARLIQRAEQARRRGAQAIVIAVAEDESGAESHVLDGAIDAWVTRPFDGSTLAELIALAAARTRPVDRAA